jgi:hypothetical protein
MLRIHDGQTAEAWGDILARHRLARLIGQQPLVVDDLIARALEGIACSATAVFAQEGNLTAEQAIRSLNDLRDLPEKSAIRHKVNFGERIFVLEGCLRMARGEHPGYAPDTEDAALVEALAGMTAIRQREEKARKALMDDPRMDRDAALRHVNALYDRFVAAWDKPTYTERHASVAGVAAELQSLSDQILAARDVSATAAPPNISVAEQFATLVMCGCSGTLQACVSVDAKSQATFALARFAVALAGYRHEQGRFPSNLAALAPQYLAEVPKDPFTGADFVYKPAADGYLLYSVGPNCKDDGGRNYIRDKEWNGDESASEEEQSWDDIAIRMPPTKAAK